MRVSTVTANIYVFYNVDVEEITYLLHDLNVIF